MEFGTEREAKEYLIGRIVDEARRESVELTETERKMLYFSETGWTLPDILEVSAQFDRDYDEQEYERKIGTLVQRIEAWDAEHDPGAQADWDDAVVKLSEGDHYLLVLTSVVPEVPPPSPWIPTSREALKRHGRPRGDFGRMLVAILALFLVFALFKWLQARFVR